MRRPPAASRPTAVTTLVAAAGLVAALVGAGALFLPGLVRSMAGPASMASWAYQLALAAPLLATFCALGFALPGATGTAGVLARSLGPWWEHAVAGFYLVGIPAGQVAICLVGGAYLRGALAEPGPSATAGAGAAAGRWPAFVVLAAALLAVVAGRRSGERVRLALFATVVVLSVGAGVRVFAGTHAGAVPPHPLAGGLAPAGRGAFLLLFAFFGWEAAIGLRAERGLGPAAAAAAAAAGLVAVGALFALLAGAAWAGGASARPFWLVSSPFGGAAGRAVDAVAAVTCAAFCARNLTAAGDLAARLAGAGLLPSWLGGPGPAPWRRGALLVALATAGGLALAVAGALRVDQALVLPDAMILAIYLLLSVAGLRVLRGPARAAAALAFAGCAPLLPFAGAALAFPAAVVAAVLAGRSRAARRRPGEPGHGGSRGPGQGPAEGGSGVDDAL